MSKLVSDMRLNKYLTQLQGARAWSAVSRLAQAWSAFLASPPCATYSVFLAAILFVQPLDHSFTV